jgi:hypothetical protein
VIQTAGIKLYSFLVSTHSANSTLAWLVALGVCLSGTMIAEEIFYRFIEVPSRSIEQGLWGWIST